MVSIIRKIFRETSIWFTNFCKIIIALSDEEIISQALVFFAAGFETVAATMTFAIYELTVHPEIQKRAQEECVEAFKKSGGKLTYEAINEMKYMDMIVSGKILISCKWKIEWKPWRQLKLVFFEQIFYQIYEIFTD